MKKLREINWKSIESMSEEHEIAKIEEWVGGYFLDGENVAFLEIGSHKGYSAALLAQYGVVMAIDLWSTSLDNGLSDYNNVGQIRFSDFMQNMTRLKLVDVVFPIVGTCNFLNHFIDEYIIRAAFIDGSHRYEDIKNDIEMTVFNCRVLELLMFHDYKRPGFGYPPYEPNHPHHGPNDPWGGVARAVDELLNKKEWKIREHYAGIVCLERNK